MRFGRFVAVLALALGIAGASAAAELPPPSGPILLTITGRIEHTNAPGAARFDRAGLEALGLHSVRTSTAWTDGVSTFEGVLLCPLLDRVGAKGSMLRAQAINDYSVDIPIEDCRKYSVLLALSRDGQELDRRDKGPIWIVYPRDDHPELQTSIMNTRWVWQLDRLDVR